MITLLDGPEVPMIGEQPDQPAVPLGVMSKKALIRTVREYEDVNDKMVKIIAAMDDSLREIQQTALPMIKELQEAKVQLKYSKAALAALEHIVLLTMPPKKREPEAEPESDSAPASKEESEEPCSTE